MKRAKWIVTGLCLGATLASARASDPPPHAERPNILLLVSDDQGWADIGYNNPRVYTPRLDRLAAEGARFEQHYVQPQCTPTRVALLTGRYPSRFGPAALAASNAPALPPGTPTLASYLRERGYTTHLCGKWHLGSDPEHGPNQYGFVSSYGSFAGAVGMYDHRYRTGKFEETWHRDHQIVPGYENGVHATDLVVREAVRILEAEHDAPFFLYVPFHSVHTPLDERGRFVERPTQLDPDRPGRWLDEDEIEWFHDPLGRIQAEEDPEKRLFLAALHHLDAAVGTIVDTLDRTGLGANTLVVFTSDNGPQGSWPGNAYPDDLKLSDFNQPLPFRGKKIDVWEGGIRVPAFVRWPGHIAPRTVPDPIHAVDWFPTVAALLGALPATPIPWDGLDVRATFLEGTALPSRTLYWTWNTRPNRWALRSGDWKIVAYGKDPPTSPSGWQLFDLATDPAERTDLAPSHPDLLATLHATFLNY